MRMERNPFKTGDLPPGGTKSKIKDQLNIRSCSVFEYKMLKSSLAFYMKFRILHD